MGIVKSHLEKALIELAASRVRPATPIFKEEIHPGLKDDVRKQCQARYVVNLVDKPVCIAWVVYVDVSHHADVLKDSD